MHKTLNFLVVFIVFTVLITGFAISEEEGSEEIFMAKPSLIVNEFNSVPNIIQDKVERVEEKDKEVISINDNSERIIFEEEEKITGNFVLNYLYNQEDFNIASGNSSNFLINTNEKIYRKGNNVNFSIEGENQSIVLNIIEDNQTETFEPPFPKNHIYVTEKLGYTNYKYNLLNTTEEKTGKYGILDLNLSLNKSIAKIGEDIVFNATTNAGDIFFIYTIDYGDGEGYAGINETNKILTHSYDSAGNYTANLTVTIIEGSESYSFVENEKISIIEAENQTNDEMELELKKPDKNDVILSSTIEFEYKAKGNTINNCEFNLYNKTGLWGVLIYEQNDNVDNEINKEITLTDFDEGEFIWEVVCFDEVNNTESKFRTFEVYLSGSDDEKTQSITSEVKRTVIENKGTSRAEELIETINKKFTEIENYNSDKTTIVEKLEILEGLHQLKRELLIINKDLYSDQIKFRRDLTDEQKDAERTRMEKRVEQISGEIFEDVKIIKGEEYIKLSSTSNLESIIEKYLEKNNFDFKERELKKIKNHIEKYQDNLKVSAEVLQAEISYSSGNVDSVTIIAKTINTEDISGKSVLEIIPKSVVKDVKGINAFFEYKVIEEDPVIEIDLEELENKEIIYYINKLVDVEEVKKIDTILISEEIISEGRSSTLGITGFSVLNSFVSVGEIDYRFLMMFTFIVMVMVVYGYSRMAPVRRVNDKVTKGLEYIKKDELDKVESSYEEITKQYNQLDPNHKNKAFDKINEFLDEVGLIKIRYKMREYLEIKEKDEEKAFEVYQEVQEMYKELPKKQQLKIYSRIKKLFENN